MPFVIKDGSLRIEGRTNFNATAVIGLLSGEKLVVHFFHHVDDLRSMTVFTPVFSHLPDRVKALLDVQLYELSDDTKRIVCPEITVNHVLRLQLEENTLDGKKVTIIKAGTVEHIDITDCGELHPLQA